MITQDQIPDRKFTFICAFRPHIVISKPKYPRKIRNQAHQLKKKSG